MPNSNQQLNGKKCYNNKNNKTKGFKIAHLNIRSLIKNIDQLRIYIHTQQFDIISINETWLDSTIANHEVDIDGHELIRKDRNRKGGGVAMFVRSSINYKFRLDLLPENLEIIVVEVLKVRAKSFLINTWYIDLQMRLNTTPENYISP